MNNEEKAVKVIQSCKNKAQFFIAGRYAYLSWENTWSHSKKSKKFKFFNFDRVDEILYQKSREFKLFDPLHCRRIIQFC